MNTRAVPIIAATFLALLGAVVAPTAVSASAPRVAPVLVGVTHTQVDADSWRAPAAVARAKKTLKAATSIQAQSIMGWGTENPEPTPGTYDWKSLDKRVALMVSTSARPVITLCCSPDWMKGGKAGQTNWAKLLVAPTPAHYRDFARLAVAVAKRYPQVHYFQVWNELKGFWDSTRNNWNIAAYTQMYNVVYRALKRFNPHLQVGGPYVRVISWRKKSAGGFPSTLRGSWGIVDRRTLDAITYWLKHKAGAQFISVDGSSGNRDDSATAHPIEALGKIRAVDTWIHQQTRLPIWWSEFYVGLPRGVNIRGAAATRLMVAGIEVAATSGAQAILLWDAEAYAASNSPGLWTSTKDSRGGRATELARALTQLKPLLQNPASITLRQSGLSWTLSNGRQRYAMRL